VLQVTSWDMTPFKVLLIQIATMGVAAQARNGGARGPE
jgi:hypothetical protein